MTPSVTDWGAMLLSVLLAEHISFLRDRVLLCSIIASDKMTSFGCFGLAWISLLDCFELSLPLVRPQAGGPCKT